MPTNLLPLVVVAFGITMAAAPSNAQTMGEYAATINDAGLSGSESHAAMINYRSMTDFRPSFQTDQTDNATDYGSDLDTSTDYQATDYSADFSGGTNYSPSDFQGDGFGSSIDYSSMNDYSNPMNIPGP